MLPPFILKRKRFPASHYITREKKNLEFVSLPLKYNFPAKLSRPWPLPERSTLLRFIRRQWHIFDGESRPSAAAGYRCPYGMRRGQPTVAAANPGHLLLDSFCISRVFYTLRELGVTFAFFYCTEAIFDSYWVGRRFFKLTSE